MARNSKQGFNYVELGANDVTTTTQNKQINTVSGGYVEYGEGNNQFDYLLDLYLKSPTQGSVVNALNRMVYGEGLNDPTAIDANELRKIVGDFNIFGNYTVQLVDKAPFHISTNFIRAKEVDEEGNIPSFGHSTNWDDSAIEVKPMDNWEVNPNSKLSVYYGRPYTPNAFYYSPPSYNSGMQYMEQEIEIAKYQLNHTKNGFSASKLVNFNNGVPQDENLRKAQVRDIKKKLTGGSGDPLIIAFNDDKDRATTVENIDIDNAVDKYTYASEEAAKQIMKVNGISSPVILGLPTANGFSSSADELREAKVRFINDKVKPIQSFIAQGLNQMLGRTDLEFLNETAAEGDEVIEEDGTTTIVDENPVDDLVAKEASYNGAQIASSLEIMQSVKDGLLTEDQAITFLIQMLQFEPSVAKSLFSGGSASEISQLKAIKKGESINTHLEEFISLGSDELEGFELFSTAKVDSDDLEDEVNAILKEEFREEKTALSKFVELVGTGKATPTRDSEQDTEQYAVRYRYNGNKNPERPFCKAMINADKTYRKEDIVRMEDRPVNPGFGKDGTNTYDIWLYKGGGLLSNEFPGGTCRHFWQREIYLKKGSGDKRKINLKNKISVAEARRLGFRPETNNKKVGTTPHSNYTKRF